MHFTQLFACSSTTIRKQSPELKIGTHFKSNCSSFYQEILTNNVFLGPEMASAQENTFSLKKLVDTFSIFCSDILHSPTLTAPDTRRCVRFARIILWDFLPLTSTARNADTFLIGCRNEAQVKYELRITYGALTDPNIQPELKLERHDLYILKMSMEQTCLQAVHIMMPLISHSLRNVGKRLYLHAGEMFDKNTLLAISTITGRPYQRIVVEVIASTQFGGHLLAESVGAIGVLAAIVAAKRILLQSQRDAYVVNVYKDYVMAGKHIDRIAFAQYRTVIKCFVPNGFQYDELMEKVNASPPINWNRSGLHWTPFPWHLTSMIPMGQ